MNASRPSRSTKQPKPITHAQISALAHELWLSQGCPAGSDVDIWLEAERQLRGLPPRVEKDPIPADPDHVDPDTDPAVNAELDRELDDIAPTMRPSPTQMP